MPVPTSPYINNIVEQDCGYEAINVIRKGQIRWLQKRRHRWE